MLPISLGLAWCCVAAESPSIQPKASFDHGGADDAAVTYPPDDVTYQSVDGCRFYQRVWLQPWRTKDDIIDGFDWSLPPGTKPSPSSHVKGAPVDHYPGNRIDSINTSWRVIEPDEGRFDFSAISQALDQAKQKGMTVELHVRASVWDIEQRDAAGTVVPHAGPLSGEITAPRWLKGLIPEAELTEPNKNPKPNSKTLEPIPKPLS